MKQKTNTFRIIASTALLLAFVAASLPFLGSVPAYAQAIPTFTATVKFVGTPTVTPTRPPPNEDPNQLEAMLKSLKKLLGEQEKNLEAADRKHEDTQNWASRLRDDGRDISALDTALVDHQYEVQAARESHIYARELVTNHAGFDNESIVIDMGKAQETVLGAKDSWMYAKGVLIRANSALNLAVSREKAKMEAEKKAKEKLEKGEPTSKPKKVATPKP